MGLRINELEQPILTSNQQSIQTPSFMKRDYERTPSQDAFDKQKGDKVKKVAIGAATVAALAVLADVVFAHGKHVKKLFGKGEKSVAEGKPEVKPDVKPDPVPETSVSAKKERAEEADKIYKEIDNKLHSKTETNAETIERNLAPKEKTDAWSREDMQKYYEELEISSKEAYEKVTVKATPNGLEHWQYGRKISETVTDNYTETTTYFNEAGQKVYERANSKKLDSVFVERFDLATGETIEWYNLNGGRFNITREVKDAPDFKLTVPRVKCTFDEAMALNQKYENMTKQELEKLYKEAINGNPNGISETEFHFLETYHDLQFRDYPITSEATQIKDHHYINGRNHIYRSTPEKIEGPSRSDYTNEEYLHIVDTDMELLEKIEHNTTQKKALEKMQAYDAEMASLPPLEKDCIFHRGIQTQFIPDLIDGKVGDIVKPDKGYAYYGFDRALAEDFSGGAVLTVHAPKGARISRNLEHGGEALFPRNAEYRILSKGKTPDGDWRIELEYILP